MPGDEGPALVRVEAMTKLSAILAALSHESPGGASSPHLKSEAPDGTTDWAIANTARVELGKRNIQGVSVLFTV
jgi:hypothetical protein